MVYLKRTKLYVRMSVLRWREAEKKTQKKNQMTFDPFVTGKSHQAAEEQGQRPRRGHLKYPLGNTQIHNTLFALL